MANKGKKLSKNETKKDVCSIHGEKLMPNGKCSVCVYAKFGRQLRYIIE